MYSELIGNYEKYRIKSLYDNKLIEEQTVSLEFSCLPHAEKDYFYYAVDTAESGADAIAQGFFTDVKFPA